jgi:hypothetical protein
VSVLLEPDTQGAVEAIVRAKVGALPALIFIW